MAIKKEKVHHVRVADPWSASSITAYETIKPSCIEDGYKLLISEEPFVLSVKQNG